ncbi:hypothetical protein [Microcystis sp.]|uniref:hypothetical protein n=1 Tax=Microcystis sp. TaxID=1127 RepID=UPI003919DE74
MLLLSPNCHQQCQQYQNSTILEPRKIPTSQAVSVQFRAMTSFFLWHWCELAAKIC